MKFQAIVRADDFDMVRFDIAVHDQTWYLRAQSLEDRKRWIDAINGLKACLNAKSAVRLANAAARRNCCRSQSLPVFNDVSGFTLVQKLSELETFR